MTVICEACANSDPKVRVAGLECVVKVSSLYYDKMGPYMQKIFNVSQKFRILSVFKTFFLKKIDHFGSN